MTDNTVRSNEDAFRCPQRSPWNPDSPFRGDEEFPDTYRSPRIETHPGDTGIVNAYEPTCSYCGSISGARFMELVKLGCELGPTDKAYKVYWDSRTRDNDTHAVLTTVQGVTGSGKFYFQHLSEDQKREFIDLYNDLLFFKKPDAVMRIGYPGHFYSLPYFMKR